MTSERKKILLLTHRFPYPPDKGDKIRSWHLLKFLSERYDVVLGTFMDDLADRVYLRNVTDLCIDHLIRPISFSDRLMRSAKGLLTGEALSHSLYDDPYMKYFLQDQRAKNISAEVHFSGAMSLFSEGAIAPVITDLVDADSLKWQAYADVAGICKRYIYRREMERVLAAELAAIDRSRVTFLVSPQEARTLDGRTSGQVDYYQNGVDLAYWSRDREYKRQTISGDIVFTGAMDYRPNADAVIWFATRIWPRIIERCPHLKFVIVGRNPTPAVNKLCDTQGIEVTGRVDDVRPYLAAAKISVAPLMIARGIQNKVLEAMAMSLPVVASAGALTGIGAEPGYHVLQADEDQSWTEQILGLLDNTENRIKIGQQARNFVEKNCRWEAVFSRLTPYLP